MSQAGRSQPIGVQISDRLAKLSADLAVDKGELDAPGVKIADKELSEGRALMDQISGAVKRLADAVSKTEDSKSGS
jgi:hypothetical protein